MFYSLYQINTFANKNYAEKPEVESFSCLV